VPEELEELKESVLGKKEEDKKAKREELAKRYEVMKGIPEQIVEEEVEEEKEKKREKREEFNATEIVLKVERVDARLASLEEQRRALEDRISHLSEEIGELRSSLLNLDKRFSNIEVNAERAVKAVEEVTPDKIKLEFKRVDREILETKAEIERIQTMLQELKKESNELKEILKKIKDVENVVEISRKIEEKISRVDEATLHADRTAAKVEVVFSELSEKLGEIERQKGKIARLEELSKELVKMLDEKSELVKVVEEATKQQPLVNEISRINSEVKKLKDEMGKIDLEIFNKRLQELASKLSLLENLQKEFEKSFQDLEGKILNLETTQKEVKGKLTNLSTFDKSLQELAGRLSLLENLQREFEKNSQDLARRINELDVSRLELARVKTLEEKILEIEKSKEELEEKLASLEKKEELKLLEEKINVHLELLQLILTLPYLTSAVEIQECFKKTREIVKKMKELGLWNENMKKFLSNTLLSLSTSLESVTK